MKFSDATSLVAVLISLIAVSLPLWRSRQQASIKEAIAVPTFKHATWIYVIVSNDSTSPLMIHGATLAGLRAYRHKHWWNKIAAAILILEENHAKKWKNRCNHK